MSQADLDPYFRNRTTRPLSSFSGGERALIELLKILAEGKPSLDAAQMLLDFADRGGLIIASTRDAILLENADQIIRAPQELPACPLPPQ
jgi:hypothetical protein